MAPPGGGLSLSQLLVELTQHAAPLAHTESLEDFKKQARTVCSSVDLTPQQLHAVRPALQALDSSDWQELASAGVVAAEVAKTLNALMRYGSVLQATSAAALYSWIVRAPAAPVHVLLDTLTLTGCLQRLKECAFSAAASKAGSKGSGGGGRGGAKASQLQQQQSQAAAADDDDGDEGEGAATAGARGAGGAAAAPASAADMDTALCLCVEVLQNLAVACAQVSLKGSKEALQAALEGCADLLGCSRTIKAPAGAAKMGLTTTGTVSSGAYSLLTSLFSPQHGCMATMAAAVLPRLTPLIVGGGVPAVGGKRTAAEVAGGRNAALEFVKAAFRRCPEIQDAVATLARHVCLRAPDKADNRGAAIKAAAELVVDLPQWEQEQFVGFVFELSRTKQLGLRTLSVGLANNLLLNLPEPFKHSTFAAAAATATASSGPSAGGAGGAGDAEGPDAITATPAPTRTAGGGQQQQRNNKGPAVPAGMTVAPWSVVALATMLHRCSDKSAVVRGRALSDLAEVVDCFAALLAQDPSSEQHQVAEAFVEGLGAAAALTLPQASQQPPPRQGKGKKKRAGRAGDDGDEPEEEAEEEDAGGDDEVMSDAEEDAGAEGAEEQQQEDGEQEEVDGDGDGGESSAAAAVRRQRALRQAKCEGFVAFMPAQLSADLNPVMSLVHRRCGDPKAAVRRGALQLLEALLVMRASWQVYARQLPSVADLALLEAATSDPLVSVRKAALVALSTLLELFPAEPSLCTAWVASALPLVRDVEASIQDSLSDWAAALLFDKAAEAARAVSKPKSGGGKKGGNASQAAAAAAEDEMDWQQEQDGGEVDGDSSSDSSTATAAMHELRPLLAAVCNVGSAAGACLGKLCAAMAVKRKLKAVAVARGLEALIAGFPAGSPAALGAWTVLREVAAQEPSAPSWQFLQERWTAVKQRAAAGGGGGGDGGGGGVSDEAASLLLVISHTTAGFPKEQAEELAAELLQHILSFQLPPAAAGAHVTALYRLTEASRGSTTAGAGAGGGAKGAAAAGGPRATGVGGPEVWSKQVYAAVHDTLRRYIDSRSGSTADGGSSATSPADAAADHTACVAVFTVGQVALLRSAKPPSNLTLLLQTLTAHRFLPGSAAAAAAAASQSQQQLLLGGSQSQQQQGAAAEDGGGGVAGAATHEHEGGEQQLQDASTGVGVASGGRLVPACVQAHAWTCLGKVCLVDEGLAKKVVPLFVQELGRSPFPVVRNNIMVALSDMLIQYTALVDAHMPRLAGCIRDRHELVRRQALALLANLLMKDYVKWRGPLFHRFLLALVDPSPAVRQLAEYLLRDVLAVKAPLLAYNHFVEAIFVLNGCTAGLHGARLGANLGGSGGGGGGSSMAAARVEEGGDGSGGAGVGEGETGAAGDGLSVAAPAQFTLKGRQHRPSRDLIYASLLKSMSPEHKFNSAAKLCGEVLAGVADGLLPLCECEEVLRDALCLMASKEIKVSPSRLAATEDEELPTGSQLAGAASGGSATAAEAAAKARGKLVSALMKRHLVEQVVPVLVELRRLLAEERHSLMCELMCCFAALLKEYKGEVEDILVADKQLAKEILYDIKQAELAKQQQHKAQQQQQHGHGQGAPAPQPAAAEDASAAADAAAAGVGGVSGGVGRSSSPPPAGVLPGTPVAAEVLKTAERQRRLKQQQQQQGGVAAGDMPPPSPRAPSGLVTPASAAAGATTTPATAAGTATRARLSHSSLAAAALKTPATAGTAAKTPGSLLRTAAAKAAAAAAGAGGAAAAGGVGGVVASPAPLTIGKAGGPRSRLQRGDKAVRGADADENRVPGAAAGAAGPSSRAARLLQRDQAAAAGGSGAGGASQTTTITLPSPFKPTPQRQWNIPQHVATGEKQQQQKQQQRRGGRQAGKPAAAAAAAAEDGGDDAGQAAAAASGGGGGGRATRATRGAAASRKATAAAAAAAEASGSEDEGDVDAAAAAVAAKAAATNRAAGGPSRRGTRGAVVAAAAAEPAAAAGGVGGRKRRTKG